METSPSPELAAFVAEMIRSGRYKDAREVIDEGLRLLRLRDDAIREWRDQIERGWSEAQAGQVVDGPKAMRAIRDALVEPLLGVAPHVDDALRGAISGLHVIEIEIGGQTRIGEPHDYGIMNGAPMLLFFQTAGYTRSGGLPQWRHISVATITGVRMLTTSFNGGRGRPDKNRKKWDKLFLRAPA